MQKDIIKLIDLLDVEEGLLAWSHWQNWGKSGTPELLA